MSPQTLKQIASMLSSVYSETLDSRELLVAAYRGYDMTAEGFVPRQEPQSLYFGGVVQAGQTFSSLPNGRVVRMDWDRWEIEATTFAGQMSIPYDLTLREQEGKYWLCATPIKELETLFADEQITRDIFLSPDHPWNTSLQKTPYHLTLRADHFFDTRLTLSIFGCTLTLDGKENTLTLGSMQAPLRRGGTGLDLCLTVDRCSIEYFLDGGAVYGGGVTHDTVSDYTQPQLTLASDAPCTIDTLVLHPLHSIWE